MPVHTLETIGNSGICGVWEITESAEILKQMICLNPREEEVYASFRNELRRAHWLSYRLLIREMLGTREVELEYTDAGKPLMHSPAGFVSVSHSGGFSAVLYSPCCRVGIDVERVQERIEKVSHKFLSDEELSAISGDHRLQDLVTRWAAKEALYKLYGSEVADFREHLHIFPFAPQGEGCLDAAVRLPGREERFTLSYRRIDGYMLVWLLS